MLWSAWPLHPPARLCDDEGQLPPPEQQLHYTAMRHLHLLLQGAAHLQAGQQADFTQAMCLCSWQGARSTPWLQSGCPLDADCMRSGPGCAEHPDCPTAQQGQATLQTGLCCHSAQHTTHLQRLGDASKLQGLPNHFELPAQQFWTLESCIQLALAICYDHKI